MDTDQPFDAIELALYISSRLQEDNIWLVDKLSDLQTGRTGVSHECGRGFIDSPKLNISETLVARQAPSKQELAHYKKTLSEFSQLQTELTQLINGPVKPMKQKRPKRKSSKTAKRKQRKSNGMIGSPISRNERKMSNTVRLLSYCSDGCEEGREAYSPVCLSTALPSPVMSTTSKSRVIFSNRDSK